ncbi:hypothetical protein JG687_00019154, partial [Phytophthora cactorum]
MHVPILLLWDDFSGHWTQLVTSYATSLNVGLMKVPKSATSVCQPADVAWNFPFKARLRAHNSGNKFALTAPDRVKMSKWVSMAWDELSSTTIANGYKKAFGPLLDDADIAAADLIENLSR